VGANACAFLPDGRRIVSAGWGGEVFVWDRATGKRVKALAGLDKSLSQ
jgi:WD40 repeat protein